MYERELDDEFAVQTDISHNVAQLVTAKLQSDARREFSDRYPEFFGVDPAAVKHFLDGEEQFALLQMGEGGDWDYSVELIRSAVAIDPDFAAGHFELAWAYFMRLGGDLGIEESRREAHRSLARAMELGSDRNMSLLRKAQIAIELDLDYALAESTIGAGLEDFPRGSWWYYHLASIALREGREADARRFMQTARSMDYGYEQSAFFSGDSFRLTTLGDYERAASAAADGLRLTAGGPQRAQLLVLQALALIGAEDHAGAASAIEAAWSIDGPSNPESYIALYAATGDTDRARELIDSARGTHRQSFSLAQGALALGDVDAAFSWLETGISEHHPLVLETLRLGKQWDPLRADARFDALLAMLEKRETRTVPDP